MLCQRPPCNQAATVPGEGFALDLNSSRARKRVYENAMLPSLPCMPCGRQILGDEPVLELGHPGADTGAIWRPLYDEVRARVYVDGLDISSPSLRVATKQSLETALTVAPGGALGLVLVQPHA